MGLITKEVEVKISGLNYQWYVDRGYTFEKEYFTRSDGKPGAKFKPIIVKVEDLKPNSRIYVDVVCDKCGDTKSIQYASYTQAINRSGEYYCIHCNKYHREQTCIEKFGTAHPAQLPEMKEKSKQKCLEKYNVEYAICSPQVREKVIQSNIKHWGVENVSQSEIIKEKKRQKSIEKFGTENVLQVPEIREKIRITNHMKYGYDNAIENPKIREKAKQTNLNNWGYENVFSSPEIISKIHQTMHKNNNFECSSQQKYIFDLLGGELNYPINRYMLDIAFPDENIYIEYNGSGHFLCVKLGHCSQEEFNQKEIIRNNILKRRGWKKIEIISSNDKLPSDEILLQMLDISKQYFKDYPKHSWISWDIQKGIYRNAEHKDGVLFNYGDLRHIKTA